MRGGCSRCSGTCCRTRSSSHRPAGESRSRWPAVMTTRSWKSSTPEWGFQKTSSRLSSTSSARATAQAAACTVGWVSASRLLAISSSFTAARSKRGATARAPAPRSWSRFRWRTARRSFARRPASHAFVIGDAYGFRANPLQRARYNLRSVMDRSLNAAALRLAAIVEFSDDAIVSKDLNGIVTSWNRAAERMFGYTAAEAIGNSITLIVPPERVSEEQHVLTEIRAGRTVDHSETMRRRKDGTTILISLTVSPIRDADGRIIGASKIARDISDRRGAEAALAVAEARQNDLQQRLVALVAASGTLFGSPKMDDVLPALV